MLPAARGREDLQAGDGVVEEEGEGVVVGVAAGPDVVAGSGVGIDVGGSRVVEHVAEVLEAGSVVAAALDEVVGVRELEDVGEEAEEGEEEGVVDFLGKGVVNDVR